MTGSFSFLIVSHFDFDVNTIFPRNPFFFPQFHYYQNNRQVGEGRPPALAP
jgi:hypothetical protein